MLLKTIAPLVLLCFILTSCFTNFKELDREVHVRVNSAVPVSIDNQGNSNFSSYANETEYREAFLSALKSDLQGKKVVLDDQNPEFEVFFNELQIVEKTETDSIVDSDSPDNGKVFELTTLDNSVSGRLVRLSDGQIFTWTAYKDKSEKTTTSRSAAQIATGDNKDKNEYREKEFDSGTAIGLVRTTGDRSSAVIVKELIRIINE